MLAALGVLVVGGASVMHALGGAEGTAAGSAADTGAEAADERAAASAADPSAAGDPAGESAQSPSGAPAEDPADADADADGDAEADADGDAEADADGDSGTDAEAEADAAPDDPAEAAAEAFDVVAEVVARREAALLAGDVDALAGATVEGSPAREADAPLAEALGATTIEDLHTEVTSVVVTDGETGAGRLVAEVALTQSDWRSVTGGTTTSHPGASVCSELTLERVGPTWAVADARTCASG